MTLIRMSTLKASTSSNVCMCVWSQPTPNRAFIGQHSETQDKSEWLWADFSMTLYVNSNQRGEMRDWARKCRVSSQRCGTESRRAALRSLRARRKSAIKLLLLYYRRHSQEFAVDEWSERALVSTPWVWARASCVSRGHLEPLRQARAKQRIMNGRHRVLAQTAWPSVSGAETNCLYRGRSTPLMGRPARRHRDRKSAFI